MIVACPLCGVKTEWEGNRWRPFCSERCKMIDLGAWVAEEYCVPDAENAFSPDAEEPESF